MGSDEYEELKKKIGNIEKMLSNLAGATYKRIEKDHDGIGNVINNVLGRLDDLDGEFESFFYCKKCREDNKKQSKKKKNVKKKKPKIKT